MSMSDLELLQLVDTVKGKTTRPVLVLLASVSKRNSSNLMRLVSPFRLTDGSVSKGST